MSLLLFAGFNLIYSIMPNRGNRQHSTITPNQTNIQTDALPVSHDEWRILYLLTIAFICKLAFTSITIGLKVRRD